MSPGTLSIIMLTLALAVAIGARRLGDWLGKNRYQKEHMMDAYQCDGCKVYKDGTAPLSIERGDPPWSRTVAEPNQYHACSWECVETIGARNKAKA